MNAFAHFARETFCDARGRADGKLLTTFAVAVVVVVSYPVGWIWGRWTPEYIWAPTLLFLATALGLDAYITGTKIRAESPAPAATVGTLNADTINVTNDTAAQ